VRQRDLDQFRRALESRRREILSEAEHTFESIDEKPADAFADPTDRASHEAGRAMVLRIRERERKLLAKIDDACARIESGSYGRCEECGGAIGLARLKARPVTTLCIGCKSAQEARERQIAR
jgi:DnaK suppressor protein